MIVRTYTLDVVPEVKKRDVRGRLCGYTLHVDPKLVGYDGAVVGGVAV